MPYLLLPRRHTGHRLNGDARPRCGVRGAGRVVDELPPNRVPCQLCEPVEATPTVEVKNRAASKKHQGSRPRRSRARAHAR